VRTVCSLDRPDNSRVSCLQFVKASLTDLLWCYTFAGKHQEKEVHLILMVTTGGKRHEELTSQRMTTGANAALCTRCTLMLMYLEFYACEEIGKCRLPESRLAPFHKPVKVNF